MVLSKVKQRFPNFSVQRARLQNFKSLKAWDVSRTRDLQLGKLFSIWLFDLLIQSENLSAGKERMVPIF